MQPFFMGARQVESPDQARLILLPLINIASLDTAWNN